MQSLEKAEKLYKEELKRLAESSMDIVEGWDIQDEELISVMGKKAHETDKDIYEDIMKVVKENPLNKRPVPKGFNTHMRPLILAKL